MKTTLVIRLQVPGMHWWEEAREPVAFLRHPHRHIFHFELGVPVQGLNREYEFLELKSMLMQLIKTKYGEASVVGHVFGKRSCEQIATDILDEIPHASWCSVSEDGENGAKVER